MPLNDRITLTESGFLFDHATGITYTLNNSGTYIMQQLLAEKEPNSILRDVMNKFEVDEREARFDIEQFVTQIKKFSLL